MVITSPALPVRYARGPRRKSENFSIPFPPPTHKAGLSAFPPVAEKGRFPPLAVVDIQAKTPPRGLRPAFRSQEAIVLRKLRCCLRSSTVSRRGPFCSWVLRRLTRIPVVRSAVSKSGPPALLDDAQDGAIEAILATARSPRERDRRGMVDIALVLALRDCGLRRSEAAALVWSDIRAGTTAAAVCSSSGARPFRPARARRCSSPAGPLPPRSSLQVRRS